jgi:hypothetical protein
MDRAGWQVVSGVLGLAVIGLAFGLQANRTALTQERNDRLQPCVAPQPITIIENAPAETTGMPYPDNARCKDGVLIIKTVQGFESLTHDGAPIACNW